MIRQTRQRAAIAQALRQEARPLTPQEVFQTAQKLHPALGLRTVYRQLHDLEAAGEVVAVQYPGQPIRYERALGHDVSHFICRCCQKVFVAEGSPPDVSVTPPAGFQTEGQETIFFGVCADCQQPSAPE